jgi:hypothetical protein
MPNNAVVDVAGQHHATASRRFAPWLWLLLALFCLRVAAQLLQWRMSLPYLPPFSAWHSGALPYGILVTSQLLIILMMVHVCYRFTLGRVAANHKTGLLLLVIGGIYFLGMLGRLLLGLLLLPEHAWFGATLPALFHLVLALFVLLVGRFHFSRRQEEPC